MSQVNLTKNKYGAGVYLAKDARSAQCLNRTCFRGFAVAVAVCVCVCMCVCVRVCVSGAVVRAVFVTGLHFDTMDTSSS